jgi:hypothetical protein
LATVTSSRVGIHLGILLAANALIAAEGRGGWQTRAQSQAAAEAPLTVEVQREDADGKRFTATLTNHSGQSITAWTLRVDATYVDATSSSYDVTQEFYGADGFEAAPDNRPLDAGTSRVVRLPVAQRAATMSQAKVTVLAVVLDNGGSWGDPDAVSTIFRKRLEDLAEIRALKKLLSSGRAEGGHRGRTLDETRAAIRRFARGQSDRSNRVSVTLDATLEHLERLVAEGKVTQDKAHDTIERLLDMREAAAARHAKEQ